MSEPTPEPQPEPAPEPGPIVTRNAELVIRSTQAVELRSGDAGERIVEGIAVPWDEEISVWGQRERFQRGAFGDFTGGAPLYGEHGHQRGHLPIGRVLASEARDAGQWFRAQISATPAGDEAYTLLRDGVLDRLSVGFEPVTVRAEEDGSITYVEARFREVSLTGIPAYSKAAVTAVRSLPTTPAPRKDTMTPEELARLTAEIAELRSANTELRTAQEDYDRRLTVLATDGIPAGGTGGSDLPAMPYRSLAEFVAALAQPAVRRQGFDPTADAELITRHAEAAAERFEQYRAYTGQTTTGAGVPVATTWLDRAVRLVEENRQIFNLFSREPLPADGMTVSYPLFGSKSGDVAKQAAEGDNLAYLALVVGTASAAVETYGGYSELTRQVIERAGIAYLAKVLRMQEISYAKITNGVARTILTGWAGTNTGAIAAAPTAPQVINGLIDGLSAIHNNSVGLEGEFWLMPLSVFKTVGTLTDSTGRPIFALNGDGVNTIGSASLPVTKALRGSVAGFPLVVDLGMTGTSSYVCSSEALTLLESPGAPFKLQDENIINLTKQFSLYGYLAATKNDAKGITKISHA